MISAKEPVEGVAGVIVRDIAQGVGLEEISGWIGHNGQIPGYFTFEVYNPKLDATIVIAMNSDKKVNGEQGINVLLRDISKILFPHNPVNVPVIK